MPGLIDYYFAPISGYAYLGHRALIALAADLGARVRYHPLVIGQIFAASGTTPPFAQSAPRKSYRIADQARWAAHYDLPITAVPRHWPTDPVLACKVILAAGQIGVDQDATSFACLAATWAHERDIADPDQLRDVLQQAGLPAQALLQAAAAPGIAEALAQETEAAIAAQIFGSPSYVVAGERFWGQDRLPFLRAALTRQAA